MAGWTGDPPAVTARRHRADNSAPTLSKMASATASLVPQGDGGRPTRRPRRWSPRWCRGRIRPRRRTRRWPPSGRRPWPASLATARSATWSVSAAKPTRTWPGRRRRPSSARMSGVGSRTSSGTPSALCSLDPATTLGRKSATAAAMITTSARPAVAQHGRLHVRGRLHPLDGHPGVHRLGARGDQHHLGAAPAGRRRPRHGPAFPRSGW